MLPPFYTPLLFYGGIMGDKVKSKLATKDSAGAVGAVGGGGIFIAWQPHIMTLWSNLYGMFLNPESATAATSISTDITIIIASGVAAYFASKVATE